MLTGVEVVADAGMVCLSSGIGSDGGDVMLSAPESIVCRVRRGMNVGESDGAVKLGVAVCGWLGSREAAPPVF